MDSNAVSISWRCAWECNNRAVLMGLRIGFENELLLLSCGLGSTTVLQESWELGSGTDLEKSGALDEMRCLALGRSAACLLPVVLA